MAGQLGYRDERTVLAWCVRHKLEPHKDGKQWYVFEDDFNIELIKLRNGKKAIFEIPKIKPCVVHPEIEYSRKQRLAKIQAKDQQKEQANWPVHFLQ